jgi:hypothetical protein
MNNRPQPNHSTHQLAETEELKDQLKKRPKVAGWYCPCLMRTTIRFSGQASRTFSTLRFAAALRIPRAAFPV